DLCDKGNLDLANEIAENAFLLEEFLLSELDEKSLQIGNGREVYLHGHCHTKALVGNEPLMELLKRTGFKPIELQTGCCGMAGSFGYDKDKFEVSMQIGEQVLFPALRELPADALVCAPGFSCRHQIADGTGMSSKHPAEILEENLV
ncbi:MAG: FAD-binding oxidoreductase, partial [Bacteroidetes bacterium]|nr:FAD-binding oxidoreductase [Bacteroidota bacterium]